MVTYEVDKVNQDGTVTLSLEGLSSDTKPISVYKKMKIANGSTFLELDSKKILFYDEEGEQWH